MFCLWETSFRNLRLNLADFGPQFSKRHLALRYHQSKFRRKQKTTFQKKRAWQFEGAYIRVTTHFDVFLPIPLANQKGFLLVLLVL